MESENTGGGTLGSANSLIPANQDAAQTIPNTSDSRRNSRKSIGLKNTKSHDSPDDDATSILDDFESSMEDLDNEPTNPVTKFLELLHSLVGNSAAQNPWLKVVVIVGLFLLYNAYIITAVAYHIRNDTNIEWCEGLGFLIVCTGLVYFGLFYYNFAKPYVKRVVISLNTIIQPLIALWFVQLGLSLLVLVALIIFVVLDTRDNRKRLISSLGLVVLVLLGVIISKHPGRIRWRHVIWGMTLQFLFGLLILRWSTGRDILQCISDKVTTFLNFANSGSSFVYGYLATGFNTTLMSGDEFVVLPGVFVFQSLSAIYFLSFFIGILYHFGTMSWIVAKMGWVLEVTVGTTAAESMNAAANIFLGQSEAPLTVKPYIGKMTNSELNAIMTGGFATIAGTVLGAYISFGVDPFHLLSASVMSAPAALAYAKILYPETKKSMTNSAEIYSLRPKKMGNALDAGTHGASQGVFLVLNIVASLIAITSFVTMLDVIINWFGVLVGIEELTFQWLVAKIFTPLAWVIGIDNEEIEDVALLLGVKTVVNEFVAYGQLTQLCLSPRSVTISTYSLCCFANFSSIGITLGGISAMCPERRNDLTKVVFTSFIGGNAAALLTACVAGSLSTDIGYAEWYPTRNCSGLIESGVASTRAFSASIFQTTFN